MSNMHNPAHPGEVLREYWTAPATPPGSGPWPGCWPENCRLLDRYSWDSFLSNSRTLFCRSERFFITAAFRA